MRSPHPQFVPLHRFQFQTGATSHVLVPSLLSWPDLPLSVLLPSNHLPLLHPLLVDLVHSVLIHILDPVPFPFPVVSCPLPVLLLLPSLSGVPSPFNRSDSRRPTSIVRCLWQTCPGKHNIRTSGTHSKGGINSVQERFIVTQFIKVFSLSPLALVPSPTLSFSSDHLTQMEMEMEMGARRAKRISHSSSLKILHLWKRSWNKRIRSASRDKRYR